MLGKEAWFPQDCSHMWGGLWSVGSGQLHFLWNKEMGEESASLSYSSF